MDKTLLDKLGKEIGEIASVMQKALVDNKIDILEYISIGKEFISLSTFSMKNKDVLVAMLKDGLTYEEGTLFFEGFKSTYIVDDKLSEEKVEDLFKALLNVVTGISTAIDLLSKKPEVVVDQPAESSVVESEKTPVV
jgi:hypothetical protein